VGRVCKQYHFVVTPTQSDTSYGVQQVDFHSMCFCRPVKKHDAYFHSANRSQADNVMYCSLSMACTHKSTVLLDVEHMYMCYTHRLAVSLIFFMHSSSSLLLTFGKMFENTYLVHHPFQLSQPNILLRGSHLDSTVQHVCHIM
jgi:hypothetical protein